MREKIRRRRPKGVILGRLVEIPRNREKAFCAEEPPVGDLGKPAGAKRSRQPPTPLRHRIGVINRPIAFAAAGLVIAGQNGNALQQGGLAGTIFADNDGDRPGETQLKIVAQEWKTEWIGLAVGNARWLQPEPLEIRRRQIDG